MEKKSYEVVTDNWPRKNPAGAGAVVELTEIEARYSILSGDLKRIAGAKEQPKGKPKAVDPAKGEDA